MEKAMKNQNDLAMLLADNVISALAKHSNCVCSPASIYAVLTMMAASIEGESLRSLIVSSLKSSSIDELYAVFQEVSTTVFLNRSGGPKITAANGVWMEQSLPLKPFLKDIFVNYFKAEFAQVDFRNKAEQVREEVNSWVENNTNGLIKKILPPESVTSLTDIVFGNALYFKGVWEDKFHKSMTKDKDFHLLNGSSVSVPFMSSYENQYITEYDGFKVLRLPFRQSLDINKEQRYRSDLFKDSPFSISYKQGYVSNPRFSMYFYLPKERDGLGDLVKKMAFTSGFLDSHIPSMKERVGDFTIPKFKIEFGFDCSKAFNNLDSVQFYHKACVEIDEEGAEATAATIGLVCFGSIAKPKTVDFVADHPFLFMIREDRTGTILFVGQIFDPSQTSSV